MPIRWMMMIAALAACARGDRPADPPRTPDAAPGRPAAAARPADSASAPRPSAPAPAAPAPPAAPDTMLTPWTPIELPSEPWDQSAATAEALLRQVRDVVAAQLEEPDAGVLPTRMETLAADSAVGILVHPDLADDSVADIIFRIHMRREGSAWKTTAVARRERCRRGVAPEGLCV